MKIKKRMNAVLPADSGYRHRCRTGFPGSGTLYGKPSQDWSELYHHHCTRRNKLTVSRETAATRR